MLNIGKTNQNIIIMLAILFLLGRVVGLHAHGHMDMENSHHEHDSQSTSSHHHDHLNDKTHVANNLIDDHHFTNSHDDHGTKVFDIESDVIVKKQNQSNETNIVFLVFLILLIGFCLSQIRTIKPKKRFNLTNKPPYFKNHPLRAPPLTLA